MADISTLLILHNIDAGNAPQLVRILCGKIESGECCQGDILPAADLTHEYNVSIRVTYSALAMLAANWHLSRPEACTSYSVIWQAEI